MPESSNARNQTPLQSNIPRSFLYSDNVIHEGLSACNHSIIGKIITAKPIHISSIQNGLESIWGSPPGLKVQELGGKILQFFMNEPADIDRILYGNPWIFRNSWLVVKPWDRETDYHEIDFDHIPVWIQLWGLPTHCKTKQMGASIGELIGKVEASEFYEYPGKKIIIKIKVAININNPITSGIHVGNPTDGTCWVDYRYEKLPQVCFKCGMIGHADKLCRNQALVLDTLAPLGPWIRSTQYGKRKMEEKDRKYYSNPSHAKNFGQYSPPVPTDLLEKLAAMRVNTAQANQTQQTQNHPINLSPQYNENSPRKDMHSQQGERNKKSHQLSYNQEATKNSTGQPTAMKFISWNCRGIGNPKTVRAFKKLLANHKPDIFFLMETKLQDTQYLFLNTYKDTYSTHFVNCSVAGGGRAGGSHTKQQFSKKFEQIWTTDAQHTTIVKEAWQQNQGRIGTKLQHTLEALHNWGRKTFGIIPKRIKETQQDLYTLQQKQDNPSISQQIIEKERVLDDLLEKEEMWWSQRSRALWLIHGDKNTKFFHQKASQRRRKNTIEAIKDQMDVTHTNLDEIETIFLNHFQQLFTSQPIFNVDNTVQVVKNRVDQNMYEHLNNDFTEEEVFQAIKDMKSLAAPGPDGLPARFYHTYWDIVGKDITREILQVLNHGGNPTPFNDTHICLIPKINKPSAPSEFRPISLCNVTLKIITKTIANRLKTILPNLISHNQSAFVPGRLITDNTLVANEIFHYLNQTNRQNGYVGIKTDMAKAYDRVEWGFLQATLESMNFPPKIINTIMQCVTTVSFSILINGSPTKAFLPTRGLRQGDPLSPYLFILCADVLSALISSAQENKLIHGVKIAPRAPEITHLFFADDSIMFCRATIEETEHMKMLISKYQQASGQLVNYHKSELIFSKKVNHSIRMTIQQILPMTMVDHFSKYLGQPTVIGRSKKQAFSFIQDKVWKKLKGWKEKNLSFAGRGTLIKAVAQAIPTYLMSSFLLPKGLCNLLEQMSSKFWWGSNVDQRKIHWVNWRKTCKQKNQGGMGFRDIRAFNEALLAKQGWRILTEPNSLVAKILKAKYFPHGNFLQATQGKKSSYSWQSIQKASWILKKGCFWLVENGQNINIWEDRWINPQGNSTTWTPKPINTNLEKVKDLINPTTHTLLQKGPFNSTCFDF
ncbi:ribonuclease H [Trifolium pratense]|uniref:Ribonuclease H n=1 Tax=Trifolium pratense TaxID=57577 RepID=A0A2K3NZU6_TRIPR|nr:ribonuclease H [Trifolium pratense]